MKCNLLHLTALHVVASLPKSYERITKKFYGGVGVIKGTSDLNCGGDPDHHAECPTGNPAFTQHIKGGFL